MEKTYAKNQGDCELTKACPETVKFLLDYSKSLHIVKYDGVRFENNLN
ncbi:hypothetical protein [Maribacter sp. 2-571]